MSKLIKTIQMNKKKWKILYISRLINSGLSLEEAKNLYINGIDTHDYNDDPISQADDEISYMQADR